MSGNHRRGANGQRRVPERTAPGIREREAAECEAVAAICREAEEREAAEWQRWAKRQAVTV